MLFLWGICWSFDDTTTCLILFLSWKCVCLCVLHPDARGEEKTHCDDSRFRQAARRRQTAQSLWIDTAVGQADEGSRQGSGCPFFGLWQEYVDYQTLSNNHCLDFALSVFHSNHYLMIFFTLSISY